MLPVAVVILWQPLLMRSGDVNVNIFIMMIGTLVFGIGVDDAIHVMHRIQEEGESAVDYLMPFPRRDRQFLKPQQLQYLVFRLDS